MLKDEFIQFDNDVALSSERYLASWTKGAFEIVRIFVLFIYIGGLLSVYIYINIYIGLDIWENSNFSGNYGKYVVAIVLLVLILDTILAISRSIFKFTFTDTSKIREIRLLDEDGNLKDEYKKKITEIVLRRRYANRVIVDIIVFGTIAAWAIYVLFIRP
ncbi:MAG: hypothetical protein Rhirs2KO_31100 [Rhizobiaceae bacterium]